jgi:hypothetical protein
MGRVSEMELLCNSRAAALGVVALFINILHGKKEINFSYFAAAASAQGVSESSK